MDQYVLACGFRQKTIFIFIPVDLVSDEIKKT
jgi:hypothetical protein